MAAPKIVVRQGIAGQIQISVPSEGIAFVGSSYGAPGPVVLILPSGNQVFVDSPGRYGDKFNKKWVERFLADDGRSRTRTPGTRTASRAARRAGRR